MTHYLIIFTVSVYLQPHTLNLRFSFFFCVLCAEKVSPLFQGVTQANKALVYEAQWQFRSHDIKISKTIFPQFETESTIRSAPANPCSQMRPITKQIKTALQCAHKHTPLTLCVVLFLAFFCLPGSCEIIKLYALGSRSHFNRCFTISFS